MSTVATTSAIAIMPSSRTKIIAGATLVAVCGAYYYHIYSRGTKGADKVPSIPTLQGMDKWVDLKLIQTIDESHNVKRFRFALPSEKHVLGMETASAVLVRLPGEENKKLSRPYTPITDVDQKGYVDLLIKRYETGKFTPLFFDKVKNGDTVQFLGPAPKYKWEPNKHQTVALLAGGTGITPMYQLMRAIFNNPEDRTKVLLIDCNISEDDILLKKEFDIYRRKFPDRFQVIYLLDKPLGQYDSSLPPRVNREIFEKYLPKPGSDSKIFVCGPPGFYKAVSGEKQSVKKQGPLTGILAELGYTADDVYKF